MFQNDIFVFDESRNHKLLLKNVGNIKKALKSAKLISKLTGITFIENEKP